MLLPVLALVFGILILLWSSDLFVDGASMTAKLSGMSPLLIGMIVIGFGTSMPELIVSALASLQGNPALALGNAYGSNISNIALILGLGALVKPIRVQSGVIRRELPILLLVSIITVFMLSNLDISRGNGIALLVLFVLVMGGSILRERKSGTDELVREVEAGLSGKDITLPRALGKVFIGLAVLVASSRLLVWGAVRLAQGLGVSDLIIGLTVVAVGTSLPELASTLAAVRKGEDDLAVGNIVGSNLFNTLAVVGITGVIHPLPIGREVLMRDMTVMTFLTFILLIFGYGWGRQGRINRLEGCLLLLGYGTYLALLAGKIPVFF